MHQKSKFSSLEIFERTIETIAIWCSLKPWLTLILSLCMSCVAGWYVVQNFKINTDTSRLISDQLSWRKREVEFDKAFPHQTNNIVVVIDASSPDQADEAAQKLELALSKDKLHFEKVNLPGAGPFFDRNGLLFLKRDEIDEISEKLIRSQSLLNTLISDPTLRGFAAALGYISLGIERRSLDITEYIKPLSVLTNTLEEIIEGRKRNLSWGSLFIGDSLSSDDTRRFIYVRPLLNFESLKPGETSSKVIRTTATTLNLVPSEGIHVRLTGPVPMADEEFATLEEGAFVNLTFTLIFVTIILKLALNSLRLVIAVALSLLSGLILTAALGLFLVSAFNPISVAFAVLFVGIGVDFGIQYTVRYREERFHNDCLLKAIKNTSRGIGKPLAVAAAATTAGFCSFLTTDYRGVSELGLVAGLGMIIAFCTCITILPSLLILLKPPGEKTEIGYKSLIIVDTFTSKYRWPLMILTFSIVIAGLPKLSLLHFDFNPLNLRNPKVESISTLFDLMKDSSSTPDKISIISSTLQEADKLGKSLKQIEEVKEVRTLSNFIPKDQDEKILILLDTNKLLYPTLYPAVLPQPPAEMETNSAIEQNAELILGVKTDNNEASVLLHRLGTVLKTILKLSKGDKDNFERNLFFGFDKKIEQIRRFLEPYKVTEENLPMDLKNDWITHDGRARIEVIPKGDTRDNKVLENFARAVLEVAPEATGPPILIQESARTVVSAFIQAAMIALTSITLILLFALRRIRDVLVTLIPLLVASIVTLELSVILGLQLNFANIIALPLLLGVGVAFKIYYVLAWRSGVTNLLASPLTRAVLYSALTTATAFGSLWFSNHPGTSSMGKLLALSLITTLAAAVLFQPILMGPPRREEKETT